MGSSFSRKLCPTAPIGGPNLLTFEILVWDAFTGRTILSLPFSFSSEGVGYFSWQLSPNGKRLAYVPLNNQVRIWDAVTGHELFVYRSPSLYVQSVVWSPDGTRLVSVGLLANFGEEAQVWHVSARSDVYTYNVSVNGSIFAFWSPDGKLLALAGDSAVIQILQAP